MQIKYIDGPRLQRAIQAGINHVITRKDYLNKINVFPVPDDDTGTNMVFTLATISEETKSNNNKRVSKVADTSLNGARGNSGSILVQFFVGFVDFLEGINHFIEKGEMDDEDTSTIAEAVENFEVEIFNEFRYCTECLVAGNDIDRIKLKEQLMNLGANIVLAGSKKKAKIHIPASVSGTMQSATLAAGDTEDLPIDLIDSQNESVGISLIALRAAEAVKAEMPKEEILKKRQKNW